MFLYVLYCYMTIILLSSSEAARILAVFPAPSISHQVAFRPLTAELARRGHDVTVITPDPAFPKGEAPQNLTEIDVHDISYNTLQGARKIISVIGHGVIPEMTMLLGMALQTTGSYFENEEILNLLKTKKFDLLLVEALGKPALIFGHIFKIPVIQISSFGGIFDNYAVFGAPTHPILYPTVPTRRINNLSVLEKITNVYQHYLLKVIVWKFNGIYDAMLTKYFGPNIPSVSEMANNVDMLFLNVHPLFEGIRPVPPNIIYLGGLHQKPEKELPGDLKSYLDSSKNGVIYISFGTNVIPSMLPPETMQAMIKVFSDLPYNVLWKYDKDELPGKTDNIKIGKWFPQSDLLRHPNVKLFVTQGGLQSTDEAITAGVPLIGIPMLGDQWFNSERYEYYKIGIQLDIKTLNYDDFKNAINTVIGDESYRRNIIHLRELMNDQPMKPLERAVWWTEYVLRHGGAKHLRSPGANISWAQYLELELVLILLPGVFISVTFLVTVLYFTCKGILRMFRPVKSGVKAVKSGSKKKKA